MPLGVTEEAQHLFGGRVSAATLLGIEWRCFQPIALHRVPEFALDNGGRVHHRTLTPKQAELMRRAIANYRKAKKLLRAWEAHTQRLIELNAPE